MREGISIKYGIYTEGEKTEYELELKVTDRNMMKGFYYILKGSVLLTNNAMTVEKKTKSVVVKTEDRDVAILMLDFMNRILGSLLYGSEVNALPEVIVNGEGEEESTGE